MIDGSRNADTIHEVPEPESPDEAHDEPSDEVESGPSVLANLLKRSPPQSGVTNAPENRKPQPELAKPEATISKQPELERRESREATENTPLLPRASIDSTGSKPVDVEGLGSTKTPWLRRVVEKGQKFEAGAVRVVSVVANPAHWDRKAIWQNGVVDPVSCLPAVAVGLLLNILDALSYGMSLPSSEFVSRY